MNKEAKIKEGFEKLRAISSNTFAAIVDSVDKQEATCSVYTDTNDKEGSMIFNVRLRAAIDNQAIGLNVFPASGKCVLISRIGSADIYYITQHTEIEEVVLFVADSKITVSNNGIIVNEGENGGLIKIKELTDKLNDLIDAFKTHTHSGVITAVTGGSGAPAVGTPGNTSKITTQVHVFQQSDYENEKIKH